VLSLTPLEIEALLLSLRIGLVSVAASLPFALACAWLLARCEFRGKSLVDGVVHLPLVLPPVAIGFALLMLFGRNGAIGAWLYETLGFTFAFNWKGAALASAVVAFPLTVRAMRLSLESVDEKLESAARTLGASAWRRLFTITLPLMAPGILTGAILGFARSVGEFGATITFVSNIPGQTRTLPIALYTLTQVPGSDVPAWRLTMLSILVALIALILSEAIARRVGRRIRGIT